jgi:ankyrin repeat protein
MLYYIPIKATTKYGLYIGASNQKFLHVSQLDRISMSSKKWTHIFSYKHALAVPTNTMFGSVLTIQRVISQPFSRVSTVVIRSTDMDILSSELISALRWLPSLRTLRLVDRAASEEFLAPVVQECPVALADIGLRLSHLELGFSNCKYTTLELLLDLFPNLTDLAVPKGEFSVAHVDLMSQQPKIPIEICLFWAIYYRHENKAVQLIESKSDINYDFVYRETTIFHQAVRFMTVATVSQMIALGASINQVNGKGKTGLHLAAEHRLTAMARLLIEHGANVNAEVPRGAYRMAGRTPLHIACLSDKRARDIIADLVKAGALIDPRDVDGTTPLMVAATVLGLDEPADWFITDFVKAGADVNGINNEGKTPLMFASENGNLNMIKLLVKHGAKVNQRCVPSLIHSNPHAEMRSGATALHFAVDRDMKAVLKLLIELGADANIVSDIGSLRCPSHGSIDTIAVLC